MVCTGPAATKVLAVADFFETNGPDRSELPPISCVVAAARLATSLRVTSHSLVPFSTLPKSTCDARSTRGRRRRAFALVLTLLAPAARVADAQTDRQHEGLILREVGVSSGYSWVQLPPVTI